LKIRLAVLELLRAKITGVFFATFHRDIAQNPAAVAQQIDGNTYTKMNTTVGNEFLYDP
jgi:hypothetical protein